MPATIDHDYSANELRVIVDVLGRHGLAAAQVLDGTGATAADLDDPDYTLSGAAVVQAYRNVLALATVPAIGLEIGAGLNLSSLGLAGYGMLTAPTVREDIHFILRFQDLMGSFIRLSLHEDGPVAWLQGEADAWLRQSPALLALLSEVVVASACTIGRELMPVPWSLHRVCFGYPAPAAAVADTCRRHLGCPVEFGHAHLRIEFDAALLAVPLPLANPLTQAQVARYYDALRANRRRSDDLLGTINHLLEADGGFRLTLADLADRLHTTERTLRRRLQRLGVSFQQVVDEHRCARARELLMNTRLSIEAIAEQLGYSDAASFRRAFKKWTQTAPSQLR